jgi:hypothetical protein
MNYSNFQGACMSRFSILKFFALIVLNITLISCGGGGGDSTNTTPAAPANTTNFQGSYAGKFTGDDSGTWTLNIDASGNITGTIIVTTQQGAVIPLTGKISVTGTSTLMASVGGVSFTITIDSNGKVTGTWADSQSGTSGTITGSSGTGGMNPPVTSNGSLDLDSTDFGKETFTVGTNNAFIPGFNSFLLYIGTNSSKIFQSGIELDATGKLKGYSLSVTPVIDLKNSDCYSMVCTGPAPDAACSNITIDTAKKSVTFTNTVLFASPVDAQCKAVGSVTVNGTLTW